MLYVETHLIVGLAKGQDRAARVMIDGDAPPFRLVMPGICCMEALSVFERDDKQRRIFRESLVAQFREAQRDLMSVHAAAVAVYLTQAILEFDETTNEIETRLVEALSRISVVAEIIPLAPPSSGKA